MDGLKTLVLDSWYKLVIWVSVAVFILAMTVPLQIPNKIVLLLSLGGLLFGIGQWINHPLQTRVGYNFKITSYNRSPRLSGVLTEIAGAGLTAYGVWLLIRS